MERVIRDFHIIADDNNNYFYDVINYVEKELPRIYSFFGIEKLKDSVTISIVNYQEFKDFLIRKYGIIESYVRGDSDSNTKSIRILDIDDQIKYTTHKDATLDNTLKMIIHEIVHAFNNDFTSDNKNIIWFREGLATNLANQDYSDINLHDCDINKLIKNWYGFGKGNYNYAHEIVKYMIDNMSHDELMSFIKNPDYVRNNAVIIFNEICNKENMKSKKF